jgi:SecD/SecF fusion protein
MKKLLLILLCLPLLFSCDGGMKEKLPIGDTDIFLYETYEYAEVFQGLESANTYLRETAEVTAIVEEVITEKTTETTEGVTDLLAEIEPNTRSYEEFATENPLYALLYPNVDQQTSQLNTGPVVGFCSVKDTSALNVYLKDDAIRKFLLVDVKFAYTVEPYDADGKFVQLVALKSNRGGKAAMEGYDIVDASQEFSEYGNSEISISLSQDGTKEWKKLTAENIGRSIAIVVDGFVYAYPTVQSEIIGGRFNISGNWSLNESKELVKKIHKRKAHF